jgi:CheY-like chemotaxis protein
MMRWRAKTKDLDLDLEMSSECPRYLKGDESRMRQILINLVGNAVKFTETGGVTIRFGTQSKNGQMLVIEVQDSGPGISEEDQKRLFNPFVQLTEGGEQQGTGLGLTITRQFVELMEGRIGVESAPGKGSLFRVELPIEPTDRSDTITADSKLPGEIVGLAPGQPKYRILIAEDQHENQLLLERLMSVIDMEVKLANNGEQCVKLTREWSPDLIWMDMRMPVMGGEEATRLIRRQPGGEKVKIIAVTASVFKEEQQEILAAGMDDFIRKPFRFGEIYDCLARQLDLKYLYREKAKEAATPTVLSPQMLSALPTELCEELSDALKILDSENIARIIGEITKIDSELGKTLSRMCEYFDYQTILDALEQRSG